ncbi:MAG: GGDEF domain-containing protein [Deltaproteobacteria bacterium]|nr:GGDEF domain-containing protein [Deltaproteobacteria bacterium]
MLKPGAGGWSGFLMEQWKKMSIVSGEVPTTEELELLKEARQRVGMVIRARWVILGILAGYGLVAYIFFQHSSADTSRITFLHRIVPVIAFLAVAAYNAWYQYSYEWFVRIRSLNAIQLLFDLLFVTVIVHFSGGAVSWFWTMYMVLTLEAALIMDDRSDTYSIAGAGALAYGGLLTFEYYGVIAPVQMPFENNALQQTFAYEMIKWAWVSITNFCVAFVGVFMMDTVRRRERQLRELAVRDALTSLYNRRYFFYRLNSEIQRAKRYGRTLSLLILDVDNFKKYNDSYGHQAGDKVLANLAARISSNIRRSDVNPTYEVDIASRYGGEEFAVILPEAASVQGIVAAERLRASIEARGAFMVAERIRRKIEESRFDGPGVTISIGVASYPEHGVELESLLKAADDALYLAKKEGKNRVVLAEQYAGAGPSGGTDGQKEG